MKKIKFLTVIFAVFAIIAQTVAQPPRQWGNKNRAKRAFIEGVNLNSGQNISHAGLIKALKENDMTILRVPAYVILDEVARIVFYQNRVKKLGFIIPSTQEEVRELALAILEDADTVVAAWDTTANQVWMSFLNPGDSIDYYHRQPRHIMNPFMAGEEIVLMWRGIILISLFCVNPIWDMGPWITPEELLALNEDARKEEEDDGAKSKIYTAQYGSDNVYPYYQVNPRQQQVEVDPYVPVYVIPVGDGYYSTEDYSTVSYSTVSYPTGSYYNAYSQSGYYADPYTYGRYYPFSFPLLSVRVGYSRSYRYSRYYPYGYNTYYPYYSRYAYSTSGCGW